MSMFNSGGNYRHTLRSIMSAVMHPNVVHPQPDKSGRCSMLIRHHKDESVVYFDPPNDEFAKKCAGEGDLYISDIPYTWDAIRPILLENRGSFKDGFDDPSLTLSKRYLAAEEMRFNALRVYSKSTSGHGHSGVPMDRKLGGYQTVRYGVLDYFGTNRPENIPPDWVEIYYRYTVGDGWVPSSISAIYAHPEDAHKAREIARKWGIIK